MYVASAPRSRAGVDGSSHPVWQVLIFGRPDEVLRPGCQVIRSMTRFNVAAATSQPEVAIRTALETRPHLAIIDASLAGGVGIKLARRLRATGDAIEIVTVGDSSLDFVRASCHLGAVDIVTLPARPDRFREAADRFLKHMAVLSSVQYGEAVPASFVRSAGRWLPKGISRQNLDLVRQVLAVGVPVTSSEIATKVGLARVTCRRYLEYLVTIGEATATSSPTGPGRPRRQYEQLPGFTDGGRHRQLTAAMA